jgi:methylmalonyl-CoA mutase C-terminal domain/subunit
MPRPSRRPPGAPKGNCNALKHGRRSPRVQATQAALHAIQRNAPAIARLARADRGKRELMAHALRILADLLLAYPDTQTTQDILPALMQKAVRRARKLHQTTGQPPGAGSVVPRFSGSPASKVPRFPGSANPGPLPLALGPSSCHNLPAMTTDRPIRVLIAKPGLDGHDRGAKVVARALRDAGMEVIYTGIRQTPEMIAEAALQEDVDVIGLSILSGAHLELFPRVIRALKDRGVDPNDVLLFAGGIIPDEDIPALKQLGFSEIYRPGASTQDIIAYVRRWAAERGLVVAAVEGGPAGGP